MPETQPIKRAGILLALMMMTLIQGCATTVSSGAGCGAYFEHVRGVIGSDAPATPAAVKRRVLALHAAMKEACK